MFAGNVTDVGIDILSTVNIVLVNFVYLFVLGIVVFWLIGKIGSQGSKLEDEQEPEEVREIDDVINKVVVEKQPIFISEDALRTYKQMKELEDYKKELKNGTMR